MRVIETAGGTADAEVLEAFRRHLEHQDLSPTTVRAYLSDLQVFSDWLVWLHEGKTLSLARVQTLDLAAFRNHLIQEKSQRPASVNRRVQTLRRFYGWLEQQGLAESNPAERLRFVRLSARTRPQALRRREVLALLHAAGGSPHGMARRNTALVQLMLQTGLRVGEVTALLCEDLTLKERSGSVRVREGKGMRAREVPLNLSARRALNAYREERGAVTMKEPAFLSKRGGSLSVRSVQNVVATLVKRAKLERLPVSAHTLRHTFAFYYLKSHPDKLVDLASLLGHESLDTTAMYTRPNRDDLAADLETSALNVFGE